MSEGSRRSSKQGHRRGSRGSFSRGQVAHIFGACTCPQRTGAGRGPVSGSKVVEGTKLCKLKSGISVGLALTHTQLSLSLYTLHFISLPVFCLRLSSSVLTNVLLARRFFFFLCFFKSLSVCKNYAETEATKGKPQLSEDVCKVCVVAVRVGVCLCVCD